jgi:aspartyl-tRNA(Asn)/glutamyl-tRNA(Gln) amidotransferase subunit A
MTERQLTDLTIGEAASLIRKRVISSCELVEATLGQIEATEPVVHAYTLVLAEDARRRAKQLDRELARGVWRGPLHGVPLAIKDICYTRDAPTEAGSRALAGFVPDYDATVVCRLRDAGAVLVGKTVTHEFAVGVNTPPTRTPWDLSAYPGGSSAGSGVAVSVRSVAGAIGTDTGGSIRIPASINGIVGLKPTFGRVSRYGVVPLAASLDHVGPLTRTVEDCALVLQSIAGYDRLDSGSLDEPVPNYTADLETGAAGLVVGVERGHHFYGGVADDVRAAVEGVIAKLADLGATILEVEGPEFGLMTQVGLTIMLAEASAHHRRLLRERWAEYDPATRIQIATGEFIPASHYLTAQRARAFLCNAMRGVFEGYGLDAMLWPTMPVPAARLDELFAPRRDWPAESPMLSYIHHSFSANVLGLPALSVPCGLTRAGLPIGFQVVGRPFSESTLFRLAHAYERTQTWTTLKPPMAA